jgi:hypothetical protein
MQTVVVMRRRRRWMIALVALAVSLNTAPVRAQTVLTSEEAAKSVAIENLNVSASAVSGVVANRSPHTIRDVEVRVQYHWLWQNEFKPGTDSPGQTAIVRLENELKPGQSMPFRHALTPIADRKDGRFAPEVNVAAFTVVIPAK